MQDGFQTNYYMGYHYAPMKCWESYQQRCTKQTFPTNKIGTNSNSLEVSYKKLLICQIARHYFIMNKMSQLNLIWALRILHYFHNTLVNVSPKNCKYTNLLCTNVAVRLYLIHKSKSILSKMYAKFSK